MPMNWKKEGARLLPVLIAVCMPVGMWGGVKGQTAHLLDSLDRVLERRHAILSRKQSVISDLTRGIHEVSSPEGLTVKYDQIFNEYLHFDGDSAAEYARRGVAAALRTGNPDLILSARLCLLRAYTRQGLQGKGYELMARIGRIEGVRPAFRGFYADVLLDFHMRSQGKEGIELARNAETAGTWERYSPYLDRESPEYAVYESVYTGHMDVRKAEWLLGKIPRPSFQAANLYFFLAVEYNRRGNADEFYRNLALSAINDVKLANTEVSSILYLLQTPPLEEDLGRSYAYVQVCADNVSRYQDTRRALKVVEIQSRINKQFDESRVRQMTAVIVIAILFFAAFVTSIVQIRLLILRRKKMKRVMEVLRVSHEKQAELMTEQKHFLERLQDANERLSSRSYVYRKDFLSVYHLVSTYISYEKGMQKEVLNQLKTNNVRKAIRTMSSNAGVDDQLRRFYLHFDHAFLRMYPDFIRRLNTLVSRESRFDENMTELSTSLRIYALMVLGIADSVGIADFLHLSAQTVYNYRLKMRRMSAVGEKEFDDKVTSLYAQGSGEGASP